MSYFVTDKSVFGDSLVAAPNDQKFLAGAQRSKAADRIGIRLPRTFMPARERQSLLPSPRRRTKMALRRVSSAMIGAQAADWTRPK
jgi:hypothetical protein